MLTAPAESIVPYLEAGETLKEKYPNPTGYSRIAHQATGGSFGWRQGFHYDLQATIENHARDHVCLYCLTGAELCAVLGIPVITQAMVDSITEVLTPGYGSFSSYDNAWTLRRGLLPVEIAIAIEPDMHDRLDLPANTDATPCEICQAAGAATMRHWVGGHYDNILESKINTIHTLFGWRCKFSHPGGD